MAGWPLEEAAANKYKWKVFDCHSKQLPQHKKSRVYVNNEKAPFSGSHRGVRQGENLSPRFIRISFNALDDYMFQNGNQGIRIDADRSR